LSKYNVNLLKNDFSKHADSYNKYAKLQKIVADELSIEAKEKILENYSKSQSKILLDVGSGTGFVSQNLTAVSFSNENNINIIQSDLSEKMCNISSEYSPSVNSDMHKLAFADDSIDIFTSSLAVQWSNNHKAIFSEIDRILKPKGIFIISSFGNETLCELKKTFEEVDGNTDRINSFYNYNQQYIERNIPNKYNANIEKKNYILEYNNVIELMKEMKNIGANNKTYSRNKAITKSDLKRINEYYNENFSNNNGKVTATWEVVYLTSELE